MELIIILRILALRTRCLNVLKTRKHSSLVASELGRGLPPVDRCIPRPLGSGEPSRQQRGRLKVLLTTETVASVGGLLAVVCWSGPVESLP